MEIKSGGRGGGRNKEGRRGDEEVHGATPATSNGTTPLRIAPCRMARLAEESRQSMWHDSVLPGQLSCQRGRLVAPKHVARPFSESHHEFWHDQKG